MKSVDSNRKKVPLRCDVCGEIALSIISTDGQKHSYYCVNHKNRGCNIGLYPRVDTIDNLLAMQRQWLLKNRRRRTDGQKYGSPVIKPAFR